MADQIKIRRATPDAGATLIMIQGDQNAEKFYLTAGGVRTGERESGSIEGRYLPEFRVALTKTKG